MNLEHLYMRRIGRARWLAWTIAVLLASIPAAGLAATEGPGSTDRRPTQSFLPRACRLSSTTGCGRPRRWTLGGRRAAWCTATTQADAAGG